MRPRTLRSLRWRTSLISSRSWDQYSWPDEIATFATLRQVRDRFATNSEDLWRVSQKTWHGRKLENTEIKGYIEKCKISPVYPTNIEILAFEGRDVAREDFLYHQWVGRKSRMTPKPVKCLNIGVAGRMIWRKANKPRTLQPLVPPLINVKA